MTDDELAEAMPPWTPEPNEERVGVQPPPASIAEVNERLAASWTVLHGYDGLFCCASGEREWPKHCPWHDVEYSTEELGPTYWDGYGRRQHLPALRTLNMRTRRRDESRWGPWREVRPAPELVDED